MNKLEKILAIGMLIFAIAFNLWLYRAEPTAKVDPNDNAFQYALIDRTNQIWDWASKSCQSSVISHQTIPPFSLIAESSCLTSYLIDHWVPNWAEGYNLPYYYSHIPQIIIVGTYRVFSPLISNFNPPAGGSAISLFTYYHWIIYLLLCLFPLSVFLSLRVLKQPWLTAGIGALMASQISTDGLYGIDPSSFLWRGWGLSSQLFSVIFFPLALAYIIKVVGGMRLGIPIEHPESRKLPRQSIIITLQRWLCGQKNLESGKGSLRDEDVRWGTTHDRTHNYIAAIIFITATTMGHLGIGMMLFLSIPVITFTQSILSLLHHCSLRTLWEETKVALIQTLLLALPPLIILSYWIFPTIRDAIYHNTSFWDPIWKFNSYGVMEVLTNLFNGNLFDFGRLPIFTLLVFIGFFVCLQTRKKTYAGDASEGFHDEASLWSENHDYGGFQGNFANKLKRGMENASGRTRNEDATKTFQYPELSFLFIFYLLLYFGNTTWGGLLNMIPGMNEFHGHRFVVGLQVVGLFLAPIGFMWIVERLRVTSYELGVRIINNKYLTSYLLPLTSSLCLTIILILLLPPIYKQTISYATYNEELIRKSNTIYLTQQKDAELLIQTLKNLPGGRIFAGRGGGWGKTFEVADSPYFMYLSTYGLPTVLWLPQTWSLNSDVEQYFSEENPNHYELFNITYVVAPARNASHSDAGGPPDIKPQKFWNLIKQTPHWKLYEVNGQVTINNKQKTTTNSEPTTTTYISAGVSPSVVFSDKYSFANVVRLFIQSPYPEKDIFPEIKLVQNPLSAMRNQSITSLPRFSMTNEANYVTPDGKLHSLFAEPPIYMSPFGQKTELPIAIMNQSSDTDMVFKATIEVKEKCPTCTVILKQTYHPNWQATVNGKKAQPISVFPFFTAIRIEEPGTYEVIFTYTPSPLKMVLLLGAIGSIACAILFFAKKSK